MQRDMKTITAGVIKVILATDPLPLPTDPLSLPDDPSEPFGDEMRRVILWQAEEIKRLAALFEVLRDCDGADEAAEKIKQLQAVIDKYPKTKDGVTATPLMRVYFPSGYCEYDDDGIVHVSVSYEGGNTSVTNAYSTKEARAAAETAKGK